MDVPTWEAEVINFPIKKLKEEDEKSDKEIYGEAADQKGSATDPDVSKENESNDEDVGEAKSEETQEEPDSKDPESRRFLIDT